MVRPRLYMCTRISADINSTIDLSSATKIALFFSLPLRNCSGRRQSDFTVYGSFKDFHSTLHIAQHGSHDLPTTVNDQTRIPFSRLQVGDGHEMDIDQNGA